MKRNQAAVGDSQTDVNISPLIDMVFILLIFFIVTTVFVEESGLSFNTPEPAPISRPDHSEAFVIQVTRGGAILHQGQEIGSAGVASRIQNARAMGELESVTIEVDERTPVASAALVLDLCTSAKVDKIVMKTSSPGT